MFLCIATTTPFLDPVKQKKKGGGGGGGEVVNIIKTRHSHIRVVIVFTILTNNDPMPSSAAWFVEF